MLETEIKNLKEEVTALRITMTSLINTLIENKVGVPQPLEVKAESPKAESPKVEAPKSEVTRSDLQEVCTQIVRKDRELKTKIKELIQSFGGATNLIQVADKDLAPLLEKLKGLL